MTAKDGFLKCNGKVVAKVGTSLRPCAALCSSCTGKKCFEKIVNTAKPAEITKTKPGEPVQAARAASAASNGPCVLVIDDDPNVHRLIERTLKDEGYSLHFASNAEDGLRLARELHPALITLDVMMPDTDGWSVLSSLKADPSLARIPVIMVTIIGEKELGFALGASEYLIKPIDRNQLILVLKRYLRDQPDGQVLIVEDDANLREMLRRT